MTLKPGLDTTITYDMALTALQEVVSERGPDYVFPSAGGGNCLYRWEGGEDEPYGATKGEAACGVGMVLDKWHLLDDLFPPYGDDDDPFLRGGYVDNGIAFPEFNDGLLVDPKARMLLRVFQQDQDSAIPYGEALRHAVDAVNGTAWSAG